MDLLFVVIDNKDDFDFGRGSAKGEGYERGSRVRVMKEVLGSGL